MANDRRPNLRHGAMSARRGSHRAAGFTLVEMMVAIAILAILMAWAVPSFNDAALGSKLSGFANDIVASAQLARSEAIKRNAPITLCASSDGTSCAASGGWQVGWIVLSGADVLERHPALPPEFSLTQAGGNSPLTFPADVAGATTAVFTVCRATPVGRQERVVRVTASGGTAVTRTEAGSCP